MRKKVQSFTISDEVTELLKVYAFNHSWSLSYSVENILRKTLEGEIKNKKPVKKISSEPYVDTPADIEAMKNFEKNFKKEKTKEDLEFEQSVKETMDI